MKTGNENFYDQRAKDAFIFLLIILAITAYKVFF